MAGNTLKFIGAVLLIVGGSLLSGPSFLNSVGTFAVLCGGLIGGYMDGRRAGRREVFGGSDENPIK